MFTRSPNWPPISFARSDEWRCFGHARKLNRGHKSRSRLDITTKSWPCSCKQSPINIILVQSCISLLWDVRVGRWRCHQLSLLPPFQSHPFSFLSSENYARCCCQWFDPELKLFFGPPTQKLSKQSKQFVWGCERLLLNILMTWAITKMVSMITSMVMKMMIMLMSAWSIEAREEEGPWCLLAQSSAVHLPRPA